MNVTPAAAASSSNAPDVAASVAGRVLPHRGKLAVLFAGMGSLGLTFICGCLLLRKGLLRPTGSVTQTSPASLGLPRVLPSTDSLSTLLGLAPVSDLVFGGWDVYVERASSVAPMAVAIDPDRLAAIESELAEIRPMSPVFYPEQLEGRFASSYKLCDTKAEMAAAVTGDIHDFMTEHACDRAVVVWAGSRERVSPPGMQHLEISRFETALAENDPAISSSQIYAWAAVGAGVPFVCGGPNAAVGFAALHELALRRGVPIAGRDFRITGGFFGAPVPEELRATDGWFPRGAGPARQEHWGVSFPPPQAEPARSTSALVLDVVLLIDLARRAGMVGMQTWLSPYFSDPQPADPWTRGPWHEDTALFGTTLEGLIDRRDQQPGGDR